MSAPIEYLAARICDSSWANAGVFHTHLTYILLVCHRTLPFSFCLCLSVSLYRRAQHDHNASQLIYTLDNMAQDEEFGEELSALLFSVAVGKGSPGKMGRSGLGGIRMFDAQICVPSS